MGSEQINTLIVTLALAILAIVFFQRHRIFGSLKQEKASGNAPAPRLAANVANADFDLLTDLTGAAMQCQRIAASMGSNFKLAALYRLLEDNNWPHPHLTIRSLRENDLLVPSGEGLFGWNIADQS